MSEIYSYLKSVHMVVVTKAILIAFNSGRAPKKIVGDGKKKA